jgi:FAD-linked sulfhydryl oxidase
MCGAHNTVNRRLGKPLFNCDLVEARWAPLDCGGAEGAESACSLAVGAAPGRRR